MRKVMVLMALLALFAGPLMPQTALAQNQPIGGQTLQVAFPTDVQNFRPPQWLSIGAWALIGGALADSFLEGQYVTAAGVVVGAMFGNWWYAERNWPFN
ncbi:exported hypothetical protein [uncultured Gammaproteobacteria bacterium]